MLTALAGMFNATRVSIRIGASSIDLTMKDLSINTPTPAFMCMIRRTTAPTPQQAATKASCVHKRHQRHESANQHQHADYENRWKELGSPCSVPRTDCLRRSAGLIDHALATSSRRSMGESAAKSSTTQSPSARSASSSGWGWVSCISSFNDVVSWDGGARAALALMVMRYGHE